MRDSTRKRGDGFLFLRHHYWQIKSDIIKVDAAVFQVGRMRLMVQVAVVEQRFGRDAAHVKTGAAQRYVLLYAGGLHT